MMVMYLVFYKCRWCREVFERRPHAVGRAQAHVIKLASDDHGVISAPSTDTHQCDEKRISAVKRTGVGDILGWHVDEDA